VGGEHFVIPVTVAHSWHMGADPVRAAALFHTRSAPSPTEREAISVREFQSPDGREWRVWAVHPNAAISERRRADRRVTPVESLEDPPVLERRRGPDRRAAGGSRPRSRPGELLPDRWREGWLVYEELSDAPQRARETRRLAPIPAHWESCSEAELAEQLARATPAQKNLGTPRSAGSS
jgi:hypothetical protein